MTIQHLEFTPSPELENELKFFDDTTNGKKIYLEINTQQDVVRWIESNPDFFDLKNVVHKLPQGQLLDIGVGWGLTSAYLAIHGFKVTCLEPSLRSCQNMKDFFRRLQLNITIICGVAEMMNQLKGNYDYVVFWSSLHHCDDPIQALKNANSLLRSGGWVVLFEPVLRFYRSKTWFYRMMKIDPQKVGHYGGNEHVYRYREYLEYLREARFTNIYSRPSIKYFSNPKRAVWDNNARWVLKRFYYRAMRVVAKENFLLAPLLTKLSLLTPAVMGQRKD